MKEVYTHRSLEREGMTVQTGPCGEHQGHSGSREVNARPGIFTAVLVGTEDGRSPSKVRTEWFEEF